MQTALVLLVVACAAGYLIRQTWRTWTGGCGGCGPKPSPKLIGADELTARVRGQRDR